MVEAQQEEETSLGQFLKGYIGVGRPFANMRQASLAIRSNNGGLISGIVKAGSADPFMLGEVCRALGAPVVKGFEAAGWLTKADLKGVPVQPTAPVDAEIEELLMSYRTAVPLARRVALAALREGSVSPLGGESTAQSGS